MKHANVWLLIALAAAILLASCPTSDGSTAGGLSIDPLMVRNVTLSETEKFALTGSEFSLMAIITPSTASNQNVTWDSDDTGVATVNGTGSTVTIRAVAPGTALITTVTEDGRRTAQCRVNVSDVPVELTGITLNTDSIFLVVTEPAFILRATPDPWYANIGNDLTWTVTPAGIVSLSATTGLESEITALAAGEATIRIESGNGIVVTCSVRVALADFSPDVTDVRLRVGGSSQLYTVFRPASLLDPADFKVDSVTWVSDNAGVATVSPYGSGPDSLWAAVTGVSAGTANIALTARLTDGRELTSSTELTVLPAWSIGTGESWFFEDFENYRFTARNDEMVGTQPLNETNQLSGSTMTYWDTVTGTSGNSAAACFQTVTQETSRPGTETLGGIGNKAVRFASVGTGDRATTLNLKNAIGGDKVYAEFDWYPGFPGIAWAMVSLVDRTNVAGNASNKIVSFTINAADVMQYYIGQRNDPSGGPNWGSPNPPVSDDFPEVFSAIESKSQWFHIKVAIDFVNQKIDIEMTDLENGTVETKTGLDFGAGTTYNPQIACIKIASGRNDQSGWYTYLDNLYIGTVPKPQD